MSGQWELGTVAAIPFGGGEVRAMWTHDGWVCAGDRSTSKSYVDVRPLVVLDPEDREQVKRLALAYWSGAGVEVEHMQAALRSLLTPPKPEEPLGAGAVVEDATGDWWARLSRGADGRVWHRIGIPDRKDFYRNIDVVRVLSEGVRGE